MPDTVDYTYMWWAHGWPQHFAAAPWLRVIQTGHYALAMDTEKLEIPHVGALNSGKGYLAAGDAGERSWTQLPPGKLDLVILTNGKKYTCVRGGSYTATRGPRMIDSGRYLQRADVTDLEFAAKDGTKLDVEATLETVAWPDRLAMVLKAHPTPPPILQGEKCFGKIGGGYGFDGTNAFVVEDCGALTKEHFTLEFWAFISSNQIQNNSWLVCKDANEYIHGNYGFMLNMGSLSAFLNIGSGKGNIHGVSGGAPLKDKWNHIAMSYDGNKLTVFLNGVQTGEKIIGRERRVSKGGKLTFGRRGDNFSHGFPFLGVIDEVAIYDKALPPANILAIATNTEPSTAAPQPLKKWSFDPNGRAISKREVIPWENASMAIRLKTSAATYQKVQQIPLASGAGTSEYWYEAGIAIRPSTGDQVDGRSSPVEVKASVMPEKNSLSVEYDPTHGWHRVDITKVIPKESNNITKGTNDVMENMNLLLKNPDKSERIVRLFFDKKGSPWHNLGHPLTGISMILRDAEGLPTGIPVQVSKNWHGKAKDGDYSGVWIHGFTQLRLPPESNLELNLSVVYGHWGGVATASHEQLSLIGWGINQLWEQSSLGSWGENICYEPDQIHARASVTDMRPVMVTSTHANPKWHFTSNVGGGDFFRFFDINGKRVMPAGVRSAYVRQFPVLTEVRHTGATAESSLEHSVTSSLHRTDDLLRATYRLKLDVKKPIDFSRFVIFQIASETYSYTWNRKMAMGNENGLIQEWATQRGNNVYSTQPKECIGRIPWVSLHESDQRPEKGATANRGIIIRDWKARIGGKDASPWVAEYSNHNSSIIDLVPPPGVSSFLPGDYIEATIVLSVMPQFAKDYYGPNSNLRSALEKDQDTWRLIHREAVSNDLAVEVKVGDLKGVYPSVRVQTKDNQAHCLITGGLGYTPLTFVGLRDYKAPLLETRIPGGEWQKIDQSVHGNDFWQTDFDANSKTWEITYSVASDTDADRRVTREYRFQVNSIHNAGAESGIKAIPK